MRNRSILVVSATLIMAGLCFTGCATTKEKVEEYFSRGNEAYNKKDWDTAIAEYTRVIKKKPDYKEAYYNRGLAYLRRGDSALAANDFNEVLRIDPSYSNAKDGLIHARVPHAAYLLFVEGIDANGKRDYDLAIAKFTQAIALFPDYSSAYNNRGVMYLRKEMYDEAEADFNEVLKLNPESVMAYANLGRIYKERKDYDKAEQYLNQALKIAPAFTYAKNELKAVTDAKAAVARAKAAEARAAEARAAEARAAVAREEQESSGINFDFAIVEEDGKQTVTILGYKGQSRDVHIPNYINGVPVTSIFMMAFGFKPLTKLKLPATLIEIGFGAFFGNSLTSIVIPDSVKNIGSSAFEQISGEITDITIGSDVNVFFDAFGTLNSFAKIYNAMGKKAGRYRGTTYTYSSN
jgi:tetratricopeptide (TPR) repeat protein